MSKSLFTDTGRRGRLLALCCAVLAVLALALSAFGSHPEAKAGGYCSSYHLDEPNYAEGAMTSFYKLLLPPRQQRAYDEIEGALRTLSPRLPLAEPLSREECSETISAVLSDNPDIFWMPNDYVGVIDGNDKVCAIEFTYSYAKRREIASRHKAYVAKAENLASIIASRSSDSQKQRARQAYLSVTRLLDYGRNDHDQNIDAMFSKDGNEAVCAGYARSFQILCAMTGVPCVYVAGKTSADSPNRHAWNMCIVDGETYYVDATWGDSSGGSLRHFTSDREHFARKHIIDSFPFTAALEAAGDGEAST